jgi:hypothetical protein
MSKRDDQPIRPLTTNVKGYFNPNPYRVNVTISEPGCSVQLNTMEFILERGTGRKINDPILDKYVGYKMLSPEISNPPVPIIVIPRIAAPQPSSLVAGQVNPSAARLPTSGTASGNPEPVRLPPARQSRAQLPSSAQRSHPPQPSSAQRKAVRSG